MDPEIVRLLLVLGFKKPEMGHMKMNIIASQYKKMALIKHPDKKGGKKEDFQELLAAYEKLGHIVIETTQDDPNDAEETNAREIFKKYNFAKENIDSITIFIETNMVKHWDEVLTENYGAPIDRTDEESGTNNGKQWVDQAFKDETETEVVAKVFITMWNKKRKEKSTMLVQCEQSKQFLNVAYVNNVIPILFAEAVEHQKKETPSISAKKRVQTKSVSKSPQLRKSTKKLPKTFPCKTCDFQATNVSLLNKHNKASHMKEPANTTLKSVFSITRSLSQLLPSLNTEVIAVKSVISEPLKCYICGKGYNKVDELSKHVEEEHDNSNVKTPSKLNESQGLEESIKVQETQNPSSHSTTNPPAASSASLQDEVESQTILSSIQEEEITGKLLDDSTHDVETTEQIPNISVTETDATSTNILSSIQEEEITGNLSDNSNHDVETGQNLNITVNETEKAMDFSIHHGSRMGDYEWDSFCLKGAETVVSTQPISCEKCDITFSEQLSLEEHIYMKHKEEMNSTSSLSDNDASDESVFTFEPRDVASVKQPSVNVANQSPAGCERCRYFVDLEKEHRNLKTQFENLSVAYNGQSIEKQSLNNRVVEIEISVRKLEDEKAKLKKEAVKTHKDMSVQLTVLQAKLNESYKAVESKVEEIVKLSDENKTLGKINELLLIENKGLSVEAEAEIIYLDDDEDPYDDLVIESYITENLESENVSRDVPLVEEEVAEVIETDANDDMTDDDVIDFYLQQRLNRANISETMNAKEAEPYKCKLCNFKTNDNTILSKHNDQKHGKKCDKCNFSTGTTLHLNMHKEAHHQTSTNSQENIRIPCQNHKCDFVAKTTAQLEKHKVVRHGPKSQVCWSWQNGFCPKPSCNFEHPAPDPGFERFVVPCRYGDFCRNSFCTFGHGNNFLERRPMGFCSN